MKPIDAINEFLPTIIDPVHGELYCKDKVILIIEEYHNHIHDKKINDLIDVLDYETESYNEKFHEWYSGINYATMRAKQVRDNSNEILFLLQKSLINSKPQYCNQIPYKGIGY